jgi:hypothetical protein
MPSIWTHDDRQSFISAARSSESQKGSRENYNFIKFPKSNVSNADQEESPKKLLAGQATAAFAKVVYTTNPEYRKIGMQFYAQLFYKLSMNLFLGPLVGRDIVILIKGSNSYALLTDDFFKEDFPYSDLDIVIHINPFLDPHVFKEIQSRVKTIVIQTISQYKRALDNMFFMKNENANLPKIFDNDVKESFINDLDEELSKTNPDIVSPFSSTENRNFCSKNSFIVTNDDIDVSNVVLVDVPHYDKCEKIPLKKTPFFCSYNETIDFDRCEQGDVGNFDLFRIRLNMMCKNNVDDRFDRLAIDFIDIGISHQNDAELIDFWQRGRFICIYDRVSMMWVNVPDLQTSINDLYKMIHVYKCPDSKKKKREVKLAKLQALV